MSDCLSLRFERVIHLGDLTSRLHIALVNAEDGALHLSQIASRVFDVERIVLLLGRPFERT